MVQGKFKSSRLRQRKLKVPGGATKTRYLERKPKQAKCGETGEALHGIPRMSGNQAKNVPKTTKRPERPYGGVLSSKAMRNKFKGEAVLLSDEKASKDAPLYEVGRLCLKIAGRDAGKRCVVVEAATDGVVMIDGETRRRKCNVRHLEPLPQVLDVKKGAARADVTKAFGKLGIELKETKAKKAAARPKKVRKAKEKPVKEAPKKAETPKEKTAEKPKVEAKPAEKPVAKPAAEPAKSADKPAANPAKTAKPVEKAAKPAAKAPAKPASK
jgi:ribosomal protein L34E/ribosomal protein L14E/L6E/L27E